MTDVHCLLDLCAESSTATISFFRRALQRTDTKTSGKLRSKPSIIDFYISREWICHIRSDKRKTKQQATTYVTMNKATWVATTNKRSGIDLVLLPW